MSPRLGGGRCPQAGLGWGAGPWRAGPCGRAAWEGLAPAGLGNTAGPTEVGSDLKQGKGPRRWGAPVPGGISIETLLCPAEPTVGVRARWAMQVLGGTHGGPVSPGQGRRREIGDGIVRHSRAGNSMRNGGVAQYGPWAPPSWSLGSKSLWSPSPPPPQWPLGRQEGEGPLLLPCCPPTPHQHLRTPQGTRWEGPLGGGRAESADGAGTGH